MIPERVNPPVEASRVGIVGGGILGMTLALRLQSLGYRVTIIEAAPELGGLVGSHSIVTGFMAQRCR